MFRRISLCALALLLSPLAPHPGAGEQLRLTVSPAQSFAPATLWISVRLEPCADNRALEIVADSQDYYRSSLVTLEGERAPRALTLNIPSVPGGEYEIRGTLFDADGRPRASASTVAVVIPGAER